MTRNRRKCKRHLRFSKTGELQDLLPGGLGRALRRQHGKSAPMAGSFFFIAGITDAATRWFGGKSVPNAPPPGSGSSASVCGDRATSEAMRQIHARLPFQIIHPHTDNGGEFINHLFVKQMKTLAPDAQLSRSRPCRKNDNCRVEQKNGSVIREYFSDIRFDN